MTEKEKERVLTETGPLLLGDARRAALTITKIVRTEEQSPEKLFTEEQVMVLAAAGLVLLQFAERLAGVIERAKTVGLKDLELQDPNLN